MNNIMQIIDLCPNNTKLIQQVAALLVDSFKHWCAWSDIDSALQEVGESFTADRLAE